MMDGMMDGTMNGMKGGMKDEVKDGMRNEMMRRVDGKCKKADVGSKTITSIDHHVFSTEYMSEHYPWAWLLLRRGTLEE